MVALEEKKLQSVFEAAQAAGTELHSAEAPSSHQEAEIRSSHQRTLHFRLKIVAYTLGSKVPEFCTGLVDGIKTEAHEEGGAAAKDEEVGASEAFSGRHDEDKIHGQHRAGGWWSGLQH